MTGIAVRNSIGAVQVEQSNCLSRTERTVGVVRTVGCSIPVVQRIVLL